MGEQTIASVIKRIDRLERKNRTLRITVLLAAVVMAAAFLMGQAAPKIIPKVLEAESFVLKGPNGTERGRMGISDEGHPYLVLLKPNGSPRVALGRLYGHVSRRIKSRLLQHGTGPSAGYYDKDGKLRTPVKYDRAEMERSLRAPEPAESLMVLFDQTGNVVWSVP